jgi:hypothetical protein
VGILFSRNSLTISLGVGVFVIDLGAKAPTTNLRDLGADVFGRKYKPMCLPFSKPMCLPFGKQMCLPKGKLI